MIKQDIINEIVATTGISAFEVKEVIDAALSVATSALNNDEPIALRGFGTFKVVERAPRKVRNIRTGEEFFTKRHSEVTFEPGKDITRK